MVLPVHQAGPSYASGRVPNGLFQSFATTHNLGPLAVEVTSPYLESGLGVGGSVDLWALTAPPLTSTGGVVEWSILSGQGDLIPIADDRVMLILNHPGQISHDRAGVVVEAVYTADTGVATDTLSIPLDPVNFLLPYMSDYLFDMGGKPFPEPGDTVNIVIGHSLPPGFVIVDTTIDPYGVYTNTETFVPVHLHAWAHYQNGGGMDFYDTLEADLVLPFSYDLDGNGRPDLIDVEIDEVLAAAREEEIAPVANNPWRGPEVMVAQMLLWPFFPFPALPTIPTAKTPTATTSTTAPQSTTSSSAPPPLSPSSRPP